MSGSFSAFYDLSLASIYTAGFVAANGGTAELAWQAFVAGLTGGKAYYNIHTSTYPGGEIRGNLTASSAVPEPESWALIIAGFGLTGVVMRRRAPAPMAWL